MRRKAALGLALLMVILVIAVDRPDLASSHALLSRAEPPVNAQIREPPTVLTLYFTEPLERRFSTVRVTNQQNERLDERIEFDDNDSAVMRVHLKEVRPNYLSVYWETVSSVDGHRITGSYPLTVLEPDGRLPIGAPPSPVALTEGAAPDAIRVVAKFLMLAAGCLLIGALVFVAFLTVGLKGPAAEEHKARFHRLALVIALGSIVVMAASGAVEIVHQASELGGTPADVIDTQWGERWLWRNALLVPAALFVLAALASKGLNRAGAVLGLLVGSGYMLVTSSVSHAAAGAGSFWAIGSDFVHLIATSVWIGALFLVAVFFRRASRDLPENERYPALASVIQRFSTLAVISVALLFVSGMFNTIVEVAHPSDLLDTNYGNALLAKLLLLIPLLFAGAANAYLLRPDLVDEAENTGGGRARLERLGEAEQQLRKTIRWEMGLALAVLLVIALLVQLTPTRGRIDAGEAQGTFIGSQEGGGIFVTLEIEPREVGNNTFAVYMAGAVEQVELVRLNFLPRGDVTQESRLVLEPSNPPTFYIGQGANLIQPGDWEVQVFLRRAAGTGPDITLPFEMKVPPAGGVLNTVKQGGAFSVPVDFTPVSVGLMALSVVFAGGIVFVSVRRPGLTGGYGTLVAERVSDRLPAVRPAWSLAVLVVLGIGLGMWIGSHRHGALSDEQAKAGNPIEATAESIARGQMLFSRNCIQCHGETGRGDGPLASSLPLQPANLYDHIPYHPDQFFFSVITSGVGSVMPGFGDSISEEDRWHILNYLRDTFKEDPLRR